MATTAKRVKDAKKPKFKSRQHNRCQLCGRPRAFLRKFLAMALTPKVTVGEVFYLYQFWPTEPIAREELWRWTTGEFEAVKKRISAQGFSTAPEILATACDAKAIETVNAFFKPKLSQLEGTERNLAQANERISACMAFQQAKAKEISSALRRIQ